MTVSFSCFDSSSGASEYFFVVEAVAGVSFLESLIQMNSEYLNIIQQQGLSAETVTFSRFFLSDIANQKKELCSSDVFLFSNKGCVSIIEQRPLSGAKIQLLAIHTKSEAGKLKKSRAVYGNEEFGGNAMALDGKHYCLLWCGDFNSHKEGNSSQQTGQVFSAFNKILKDNQMKLLGHTLRTWIYIRDVDRNYQGMVSSRKDYFGTEGLNEKTRYIASTGIEAKLKNTNALISMDALSIKGLRPEQIIRMEALDHLNPTHEYGVTFERGTKILFGDRNHFHISGTASIDKFGNVLHQNEPKKQTIRTLENIEALLRSGNATLAAMKYLIVYLRDASDLTIVQSVVQEKVSTKLPVIYVQGAVCRSEWLVEIEGIGITEEVNNYPAYL